MTTSPLALREIFQTLGVERGDTLLVHSSLFHLGPFKGVPIADMPGVLFDALASAVGPEGTIVAPTFTFSFCDGAPFHLQHSPSEKMGALSEYIRQRPNAIRSPHPIQSIAACGASAGAIANRWSSDAFGPHGPFHALVEANALMLFVGCDMEAASLIHWAEIRADVPYRYWKTFRGVCITGEDTRLRSVKMFVRQRDWATEVRCRPVAQALRQEDLVRQQDLGRGQVLACRAQPFVHHALKLLLRDPLCLLPSSSRAIGGSP